MPEPKEKTMRNLLRLTVIPIAFSTGCAMTALADQPPTKNSGVSITGAASLPLGAQIPAMKGFQIRVRQVALEPGGIIANHGHATRPGAFHVISGDRLVEFRGGARVVISPGTTVLESAEVEHWVVNEGGAASLFVFDIVPVE